MSDQSDDLPELATNEDWRSLMARARRDHGWSQEELARRLGSSQGLVSRIESGSVGSSTLIKPICEMLSIPLPEHFLDPAERDWLLLGRLLRHRDPEQARRWYDVIKATVSHLENAGDDESAESPRREPPRPGRKPSV